MKRRENEVERKPTFNNDSRTSKNEKNAFDKRKHRLKKYSNRYKVDQWQERRKRAVLRGYYKEIPKDRCARQKGTEAKVETRSGNSDTSGPKKSPSFFDVARKEYERKKEETLRVKAEREEALRKYKEKKMQACKKLSKRTKKGQPVMKDRIELLLQKIQQDKAN
uniref:thyroid transcription factor 1-associated protein 26 homolog n=1 Tax=Vespula vulgaris TaxID=7454 RepID=UPI002121F2A8|nr:thyroid transcription factor 1-associated protein 26 homolog [Vespula vulgaris]